MSQATKTDAPTRKLPGGPMIQASGGLILALLAFSPQPTLSEEGNQNSLPEKPSEMQAKEQELLQMRKAIVRDTLQLEPAIAEKFWPLYEAYQKHLSELRAKRIELLTDLGEGVDGMSEEEAREYVKDKMEYEETRLNLGRAYFRKLSEFMSYRSLAVYVQVETKIRTYIEAGIEESIPLIK